jgi:hypothetical protein
MILCHVSIQLHPYKNGGAIASIKQASACCLIQAGFLLGLFFDREDGDDMSLRNIN